jgi:molybdopterin converting factor subunit 1
VRVRVRYFASIREWTGVKEEEVDLPDGATAGDLRDEVQRIHGHLHLEEGSILVAVNGYFTEPGAVLSPGDEVALFPPVSGG